MTITEIILLILVIIMALIHMGLYKRFKDQESDLKEAIMLIKLLTGEIKIDKILTEEEFIKIIQGGKKPNDKK